MQLYFVRHGQSRNNLLWDQTGSSNGRSHDPELTDTGWEQARALAAFLNKPGRMVENLGRDPQNLNGFHLTHLYCSLMLRSVQTASIVAAVLGIPARAWIDVHEEGGIYLDDEETGTLTGLPGLDRRSLQQQFPGLVIPDDLGEEGWWNRPFETMEERQARAQRVFHSLLERHGGTGDRVAIISHGGFYNLFMNVLLKKEPGQSIWFSMNNTAVTRVDFDPDQTVVVYTNRTDFLPDELIT